VLGWRDVPTDPSGVGPTARSVMPAFRQLFLAGPDGLEGIELERLVFCFRKVAERRALERGQELYFPSLSTRTLVYKGMLTTHQLQTFYPDLNDPRLTSAIALVHSRFSTNTFPSWPLAHPFRLIAHNGEFNTIKGNRNWMSTREAMLASDVLPGPLARLFPICTPEASDSASFDEVLELLHLSGRSLPHAVLMMIPEAWEHADQMDPARRAFYGFHASLMEPWDGPACVTFTDGAVIGAVLDRNGLRPGRWWRTTDDLVVLASEAGVLEIDPSQVQDIRRGGQEVALKDGEGRLLGILHLAEKFGYDKEEEAFLSLEKRLSLIEGAMTTIRTYRPVIFMSLHIEIPSARELAESMRSLGYRVTFSESSYDLIALPN
jgi:glutamate synthase (NADPH/NADH) large chain